MSLNTERDEQRAPELVTGTPNINIVIAAAPSPGVKLEDLIRALLQPVSANERRVVEIPENLVPAVVEELKHHLAIRSMRDILAQLSLGR